jgi:hypothetical protein
MFCLINSLAARANAGLFIRYDNGSRLINREYSLQIVPTAKKNVIHDIFKLYDSIEERNVVLS